MKTTLLIAVVALLSASVEAGAREAREEASLSEKRAQNPLLAEWDTPFAAPPFDRFEPGHFMPAFQAGIAQELKQVEAITTSTAAPSFENTIESLEASGALLSRVASVFSALRGAHTNDEIQAIAKQVAPLLSKHRDDIRLNEALFERVKAVHGQKGQLELNAEQATLLDEAYKGFVRGGANLDEPAKAKLREINQKLSLLSVQFGENILKENNRFEMVLENQADLAGLPDAVVSGAAETGKERGHDGKWVFTLHKPSLIPFLTYAEQRPLRQKMFEGYVTRGDHDDELDNKANAAKIAALRVARANLLGYESHADFVLEENMAKKPENVDALLAQIWEAALPVAKREARDLQAMIEREGQDFELEPWDWWYYAEKLRKEKYDLDEEALRPYFELDKVREGAFAVAGKLYGIRFVEKPEVPKYHEDVDVFEVVEADGSHLGVLYVDYFPRASKGGGAWMSNLRDQSRQGGKSIRPIIYNVGNFSKPTGDKPALLSFEEVNTLFHEFGHALHGLLADSTYRSLSGTSVARDFVELGSQIMENWASHPDVLKMYARHYQTGEPIPQTLIDKIVKSRHFNQGFATVEYLAACFLDMDWHTLKATEEVDVHAFEKQSLEKIGLIPEIVVRYRSPYFSHVFAGGYSSGYYSYIWAEVLAADAFEAFVETSLFDRETAKRFREEVLSRGGTEEAMTLYKRFRGAEPKIEPLLERRGLTSGDTIRN